MTGRSSFLKQCPHTSGLEVIHGGHIVLHIGDQSEAWDIADAFGPDDGFYADMTEAILEAWPEEV